MDKTYKSIQLILILSQVLPVEFCQQITEKSPIIMGKNRRAVYSPFVQYEWRSTSLHWRPFEAQSLKKVGWSYEGVGWVAPTTGSNVYRVYNPNSGEHLYTSSAFEKDSIVKAGWKYEGVSWHSGGKLPVYRLFNPKATGKQESHHYTLNTYERDNLVRSGWKSDGVAWNALRYAQN